jgi:hypothetical protein
MVPAERGIDVRTVPTTSTSAARRLDRSGPASIWREEAVVAHQVRPFRRDQREQSLDQVRRGPGPLGAAVLLGSRLPAGGA